MLIEVEGTPWGTEAVRSGDKALAYAVCAALDHLPQEQKGLLKFSREEIAAATTYEEMAVASEQLTMMRFLLEQGDLLADEADGKDIPGSRKIKVGMIRKDLAARLGKDESEIDDDPDLAMSQEAA